MDDNWKHRSSGMRCASCMWFAPKLASNGEVAERHDAGVTPSGGVEVVVFGRCRRHAPTMAGFPAVFGTDWCGDHKLNENKL